MSAVAEHFAPSNERPNRGVGLDPWLLYPTLMLVAIGIVMVGSASLAIAEANAVAPFHYLERHILFLCMGAAGGWLLSRIPMRTLHQSGFICLLIALVLLLAVWVPGLGRTVNGATRWIELGISGFQVGEAVKLLMIIYMAGYLVRHAEHVRSRFSSVIKPLLLMAGMASLLLLQPDFGAAVLLATLVLGMLWLGGARISHLFSVLLLGVPLLVWLISTQGYRMRRLRAFMDPWEHAFDEGFQLTQALIAIGRGEWFGVGVGASIQKLFYLPEAHTDFIMAVIAEETGFVGVTTIIVLFTLLVTRILQIGLRAADLGRMFEANCAFGIGLLIATQAIVSIGVNMGMLPTKGLTLPLISSGGSSVLMTCLALALVFAIERELRPSTHNQRVSSREDPQHDDDPPAEVLDAR